MISIPPPPHAIEAEFLTLTSNQGTSNPSNSCTTPFAPTQQSLFFQTNTSWTKNDLKQIIFHIIRKKAHLRLRSSEEWRITLRKRITLPIFSVILVQI